MGKPFLRAPFEPYIIDRVAKFMKRNSGKTAVEVAGMLDIKVGTANWCLIKLTKEGILTREKGVGPRGGWGYFSKGVK